MQFFTAICHTFHCSYEILFESFMYFVQRKIFIYSILVHFPVFDKKKNDVIINII